MGNTCEAPLYNLGLEAREVEPQPCGKSATWAAVKQFSSVQQFYKEFVGKYSCDEHLGIVLTKGVWELERI